MSRKLGSELVEQIVRDLRDTTVAAERWSDDALVIRDGEASTVQIRVNGEVFVWGFGVIPFDWSQRRSIGRAARWRHARETRELIAIGERAKRQQAKS